jgi:uncharacterized protein YaaW (UPF0174 family)
VTNKYKQDDDLEILRYANTEMLEVLIHNLIYDNDNKKRFTETLSKNIQFKRYAPDYGKVWQLVAAELQHFGGNTIVNAGRRSGVLYREILIDVCKSEKVKTDYKAATINIEQALLARVADESWQSMDKAERLEFKESLGAEPDLNDDDFIKVMLEKIIAGGSASLSMAMLIAQTNAKSILGRFLTTIPGISSAKALGVLGPLGLALGAAFTINSIAGPAFRVTKPCVLQIAAMRQELQNKDVF